MRKRLFSVPLKEIHIQDTFWNRYTHLVKDAVIPYQWNAINDRIPGAEPSHSLENFKIAAGLVKGEFHGAVFQDTDVAKWLEAVAYSLASDPDEELEKTADEVIDLIGKAQCEDGYINTYWTLVEPEKRWTNLTEGHELYTAGHLLEAAVAYYQTTGKRKFLDIMCRFADLICDTFGEKEGQIHGYPGHQEIELALVKLYYVTGERKYLETAKYFIEARGVGENYFLKEMKRKDFRHIFPEFQGYLPLYSQSHLPVREQKTAEGHAVRAVYMYCAMADLAYEYQDPTLMESCERLWDNMVRKRMYITGSIGSSGILERFTTDYDLPNDCNYSESCASIGLALFGMRMCQITRDAKYMDVAERALYNTVLAGIAQDGKSFFYVNPLEVWPDNCLDRTSKEHVKSVRQKWFGVACCPPNIARTLASLGQYIYGTDENSLYVQLFISNETRIRIGGTWGTVKIDTEFPYKDTVCIEVHLEEEKEISLAVRMPDYGKNFRIREQGEEVPFEEEKGFAVLRGRMKDKVLEIAFDAPARFLRANPRVRADAGKVALVKGPLVYALEEADNGKNLAAVYVKGDARIREVYREDILGGTLTLELEGKRILERSWEGGELYGVYPVEFEDVKLTAIPYAYWNNRGKNEMLVWIKEIL